MTSLESQVKCLYQLGKHYIDLSSKTHGDCRYCTPDIENSNCSGYYPINLYSLRVKPKDPEYKYCFKCNNITQFKEELCSNCFNS